MEEYYEHYTEDGKEIGPQGQNGTVEVDANGNIVRTISEEPPTAGNSLVTTIDLNTQEHMEDSLRNIVSSVKKLPNPINRWEVALFCPILNRRCHCYGQCAFSRSATIFPVV